MRALVAACVLLAGCEDAVVLEVHPDPNVPTESVTLFVGLQSCNECPGIAPQGIREILPGDVYFREDSGGPMVVRTAKVEGGIARFRIEASDAADVLKIAVAVDANEKSAALVHDLPLDKAGVYRVDLKMSDAAFGPKAVDKTSVVIWRQPTGMLPCIGFERWESGSLQGNRVFIVPASDPDCDAVPAMNECAPFGFQSVGVPAIEEVNCTTTALVGDAGVCKLGGPTCDELSGNRKACQPSDYCMPSAYCAATNPMCLQDFETCVFGSDIPTNAKLKCTIGVKPSMTSGALDLCTSGIKFDVPKPTNAGDTITCIPNDKMLLERPMPPPLHFDEKVTFTSRDASGGLHGIDFLMRHDFDCTYKIEMSGQFGLDGSLEREVVFAEFAISRNAGPIRRLLFPIELVPTSNCTAGSSTCQLIFDPLDSLGKCASR